MAMATDLKSKLREQVLNAKDLAEERVTVPEWDDAEFLIRGLTGAERAKLLKSATNGGRSESVDFERYFADIVIMSARDPETGELVFEPTDRDMLNGKNAAAVERLAKVARRLSGLEDNALAQAKSASEE
jgi:hypothetical protein